LIVTNEGVKTSWGFAKYLRDSFPNAVYCGFTGTPIDETLNVFGPVVAQYTMKESADDGITVRIAYEPRLARVIVSESQAKEIEQYYEKCLDEGSSENQVEESKKAMSAMKKVLGHPERLKLLARDIVTHYEALCAEQPGVTKKAMIVCYDRIIAWKLWKEIIAIRPKWNEKIKTDKHLLSIEKLKIIATRTKDDDKDLYSLLGDDAYRKTLAEQFKDVKSNFQIAIVVDMWITGFDVPSLAVMYIDKPIQKHTLIQTISRVNRVFEGKDKGLVVDYIGFKNDMMQAVKQYSGPRDSPVDELETSLDIFRNQLDLLNKLMFGFDSEKFYLGKPLERLICLNEAVEFVQQKKENENRFMLLSRKTKAAYNICNPSGNLADMEVQKAQFYLAIRSIIYKQTIGNVPDTEMMNAVVEKMVIEAMRCSGVEDIVSSANGEAGEVEDIFSDDFAKKLKAIKLPITKFNALLKLLKKTISGYRRTNKIKAVQFDERLRNVVERYNNRDKLLFTSEAAAEFVDGLSDEIISIMKDLDADKASFDKMGISYEEKAFYDILVSVRDKHQFKYADDKCIILAKAIKKLVDDKSKYTDWAVRGDIKNQLNVDLTVLLYNNGYPPEWDEEVFEQVLEQAENFKKYN
jgi:type I restriction enzyme R subunit